MNKVEQLLKYAYHYYVLNDPLISDSEYDKLFEEVKTINPELCEKVCLGYFEGNSTIKVKHPYPMLSIEKDNKRVLEEDREFIAMPKLDGVACELIYKKGELVYKLTRGDGYYGSDITKYSIKNIPSVLDDKIDVVVRGEVMCPAYKKYGKSHRNLVAGTLGLKDLAQAEERGLIFYTYWTSLYNELDLYQEELNWLNANGFNVPMYKINYKGDFKFSLPIDGIVYRLNDNKFYGEYTAHHYKNLWCWKPEDQVKESTILSVKWKSSKNSVLTPVALIDPVDIDSTTISQVNLMSLNYIEDKDIAIGDTVLVRKAKGIIPEIAEVLYRPEDRKNIFITSCPKCDSPLITEGIYLKCSNNLCAIDKFIEFFCKTMGIKGLAIKNIEKLDLSHPLDLYFLEQDYLIKKLGKIGATIYEQIQESKKQPLIKLFAALNPPKVKETTLQIIFNHIDKLDDLLDYEKLINIKGIGHVIADSIINWYLALKADYFPFIKKIGFDLSIPKVQTSKIISISGTLPEKRQDFIERMLLDYNIEVKTSVVKKSKLLIIGDSPSASKINKAKKYNIPIIDYFNFIKKFTELLEG